MSIFGFLTVKLNKALDMLFSALGNDDCHLLFPDILKTKQPIQQKKELTNESTIKAKSSDHTVSIRTTATSVNFYSYLPD